MATADIITFSKLDLFGTAPQQNTIRERKVTKYLPLAPIEASDIIEFVIPSAADEYVDLCDSSINVKFCLTSVKDDKWSEISFINYPIASLFKSVDLIIGDKQITLSPQTYSYRACFDSLINMGKNAQSSWLQAGGFDSSEFALTSTNKDSPVASRMKDISPTGSALVSKEMQLKGKLHLDLAFQNRAILGGSTLKFRLQLNDASFFCITKDAINLPNFKIKECYLSIVHLKVFDHILEAQQKALQSSPARYPITRTEVKPMTIPAHLSNVILDNVVIGKLPRKLYIALVKNKAYLGDSQLNPYNFEHFNLNFLACYVNGVQYPTNAFKPDFDSKQYIDEFYEYMMVSNNVDTLHTTPITRENFASGNTLFAINFTPDYSDGYSVSGYAAKPQEGVLRIEMRFKTALTQTITALLYCEYDNEIYINADRNAFTDYN